VFAANFQFFGRTKCRIAGKIAFFSLIADAVDDLNRAGSFACAHSMLRNVIRPRRIESVASRD
jgi:hypothetical protein